jgi:hypothetical protein
MWTLISFSPIEESDGGPVPDDAVIRGAKLRLYKESGDAGTVKVYRLTDSFNENTVTWDTKPGKWATAEGTKSVPAANGWVEIDIADEMVTNAVNFNRPVRIAICPTWSDIGRDISFHSDENPSLGPILVVSYEGEAPHPSRHPHRLLKVTPHHVS